MLLLLKRFLDFGVVFDGHTWHKGCFVSYNAQDVRFFLEVPFPPGSQQLPQHTKMDMLLFFKYYDPATQV